MKVIIAYPPLDASKGVPLLTQNRQFQYFKEPTYIYPVVPAQAATMLKKTGYEVIWIDAIAQNMAYADFLEKIKDEKPDVIAMETKTPVIKQHWHIIDDLKKLVTVPATKIGGSATVCGGDYRPWTVLFGDHVTALPRESFENSQVDFVLTGGDYDFLLLNLCNSLSHEPRAASNEKVLLEPGIWYRGSQEIKSTGSFEIKHDLNSVPFIDRNLTQWQLYATKNGNFKKTPGTYIMSGRDCWWGKCKFCSWGTLYPEFRTRSVENVLNEIEILTQQYQVKEIMDDTGTFPVGHWLQQFCQGMIQRGLNRKVILDCNMRFGALSPKQYKLMKQAGFRLVLFGLESANQKTLDRLCKNLKTEEIISSCQAARAQGLYPHITIMFGYPWETYEEAMKTLRLGQWLLKKGYAYTVQATIVMPYPGSPLFDECRQEGLLRTQNWDDYDMKTPVMKTPIADEKIFKLVQGVYKVAFDPEFIVHRLFSIRSISDLAYFSRGIKKVVGHIFDFQR